MSQTFENDKIRVTVDDRIVDGYRDKARHIASMTQQTEAQALRGLILSEAYEKLRCERMFQAMKDNEPNPVEVREIARDLLIRRFLENDPLRRTNADETMERYLSGARLSPSHRMVLDRAIAYADACLSGAPDISELLERMESALESPERERVRQIQAILRIQREAAETEDGRRALEDAEAMIRKMDDCTKRYYRMRSDMRGWKIEKIKIEHDQNTRKRQTRNEDKGMSLG